MDSKARLAGWLARSLAMELRAYEYRDPGNLLRDVVDRHPLQPGDVLLVLVRQPATDQEVVAVTRLPPERWRGADQSARSELLADQVQAMPIPAWHQGPPEHSVMTIVARYGWCVIGADESQWLHAWLFSNHLCHVFSSDLILVTEHGWTDFATNLGGDEPRLRAQAAV